MSTNAVQQTWRELSAEDRGLLVDELWASLDEVGEFPVAARSLPNFAELSRDERIALAQAVCASVTAEASAGVSADDAIRAELDRRLEHIRRNPDKFSSWEAAKARILAKHES